MTTVCRGTKAGGLTAVAVALLLVVPLAALEWWNTDRGLARLPWTLFGLLASMAVGAVWLALPSTRGDASSRGVDRRLATLGRLSLVVIVIACWLSVVHDQLPCFMGVPNCD